MLIYEAYDIVFEVVVLELQIQNSKLRGLICIVELPSVICQLELNHVIFLSVIFLDSSVLFLFLVIFDSEFVCVDHSFLTCPINCKAYCLVFPWQLRLRETEVVTHRWQFTININYMNEKWAKGNISPCP